MTMAGLRPPRNKKPAPFPCATAGGGAESEDGLPGRASGNPLPRDRGKEAGLSLGCSSPLPSWKPFSAAGRVIPERKGTYRGRLSVPSRIRECVGALYVHQKRT